MGISTTGSGAFRFDFFEAAFCLLFGGFSDSLARLGTKSSAIAGTKIIKFIRAKMKSWEYPTEIVRISGGGLVLKAFRVGCLHICAGVLQTLSSHINVMKQTRIG